jgi:hypothetical protein
VQHANVAVTKFWIAVMFDAGMDCRSYIAGVISPGGRTNLRKTKVRKEIFWSGR